MQLCKSLGREHLNAQLRNSKDTALHKAAAAGASSQVAPAPSRAAPPVTCSAARRSPSAAGSLPCVTALLQHGVSTVVTNASIQNAADVPRRPAHQRPRLGEEPLDVLDV